MLLLRTYKFGFNFRFVLQTFYSKAILKEKGEEERRKKLLEMKVGEDVKKPRKVLFWCQKMMLL